jgi:A/G-specific adenine glycosylase
VRKTRLLLVRNGDGAILLERRPPAGIWGGLWSLPECGEPDQPEDWCRRHLGSIPVRLEMLPTRRHTFTHFHLDIAPVVVSLAGPATALADGGPLAWYDPRRPAPLGLAAPIARLFAELEGGDARESGRDRPKHRPTGRRTQ